MTNKKSIGFTVRIPVSTYKTLLEYKNRYKPHLSLNSLIVDSIIKETQSAWGDRIADPLPVARPEKTA
jgi:regulatory protein YycH of two-component signal transduction system YycFG